MGFQTVKQISSGQERAGDCKQAADRGTGYEEDAGEGERVMGHSFLDRLTENNNDNCIFMDDTVLCKMLYFLKKYFTLLLPYLPLMSKYQILNIKYLHWFVHISLK